MAYSNVGTPRLYIDSGLYQQAIGAWIPEADQKSLVQLNPTNISNPPVNDIEIPKISPIQYIAFLGHNGGNYIVEWDDSEYLDGFEDIVNFPYNPFDVPYSGLSMATFTNSESATLLRAVLREGSTIGAVSIGNYYEMPHSPDLNLKLSYEYDGVKNIQTKGGATLSNASYTKPADWGDRGAWQLGDEDGNPISNLRSGRRVWDLSFSYLSDTDVFPVNASTSYIATIGSETGYGDSDFGTNADYDYVFTSNILEGTDFFSVCWNQTMGGHLPFIFQPDKDNNNPAQFAICRFDMDSLQYDQVANNVYNVKLKIRESW